MRTLLMAAFVAGLGATAAPQAEAQGEDAAVRPIRNAKVSIDGDLARVWAEYQVRRDGAVTHCGYDALHLARLGGKWKIINVSDSFKPTGCGPAW